jgi:hypothetical protein
MRKCCTLPASINWIPKKALLSIWAILLSHLLNHSGLVASLSTTYTSGLNIEALWRAGEEFEENSRFGSLEAWKPASWQRLLLGDMPRSGVLNFVPVRVVFRYINTAGSQLEELKARLHAGAGGERAIGRLAALP